MSNAPSPEIPRCFPNVDIGARLPGWLLLWLLHSWLLAMLGWRWVGLAQETGNDIADVVLSTYANVS